MKSAIVGCGAIAKVHAQAILKLPDTELVAFADILPDRAERFARDFGNNSGRAYSSLEAMVQEEQIDILHICTPHYLHIPMAVYAMAHKIHVFMEKPPAISEQQLLELQRAETGARLGVCFQNRYNGSVQAIRTLLQSGEAGAVKGARAFLTWSRGEKYYTESGWRGSMETEGGGVLINQAIHTLDLLIYLLGDPVWVEGTVSNHHCKGIINVEDTSEAYIQFENMAVNFYATNGYCANAAVLIELVCENMVIRMEETELTCLYPDGTKKHMLYNQGSVTGKDYWGSGHMACISHFYHCIRHNEPFPIGMDEASKSLRLILGIYESAKSKKIVALKNAQE